MKRDVALDEADRLAELARENPVTFEEEGRVRIAGCDVTPAAARAARAARSAASAFPVEPRSSSTPGGSRTVRDRRSKRIACQPGTRQARRLIDIKGRAASTASIVEGVNGRPRREARCKSHCCPTFTQISRH